MVKDPVCNMKVDESKAKHIINHKGKTYFFCSADCKKAFEITPEKYLKNPVK
jgi:Cu+-exporting ATPase